MFGSKKEEDRFVIEFIQKRSTGHMTVFTDSETGVMYLERVNQSGLSITPLIDSDGKPLVKSN